MTPLTGRGGRVVVVYTGQSPEGDAVFLVNQDFRVTKGASNCRAGCAFVYLRPESGRNEVHLQFKEDIYRLRLHGVRRVAADANASTPRGARDSRRRSKAAAAAFGSERASNLTPFSFRIPLTAGRRR